MKPWIQSVDQLGFVVRDVDACVKLMADQYGVGPWMMFEFGEPGRPNTISIENVVLNGQPVGTYSIRCAVCDMPNGVQLEFIEPLDDKSIFAQYLAEHGPGLQHISVVIDGAFEDVLEHLRAAGCLEHGQIATVGGDETCVFADFRKQIGAHIELHKRPENFTIPDVTPVFYPASGKMPEDTEPMFTAVEQIGTVVEDVHESVRSFNDEHGVGPWILLDFGDCENGSDNFVKVENAVNNGKLIGSFGIHVGICEALNVQLELMEPVQPISSHAEHLAKHGNDVHHLSLVHQPVERAMERIRAAGFTRGQTSTIDTTETCIYADHTELLGIFLELHKRPENFVPPQVELESYPPELNLHFGE